MTLVCELTVHELVSVQGVQFNVVQTVQLLTLQHTVELVSWSLTSLFSTNMAISETNTVEYPSHKDLNIPSL